jgi:hypothetical protein
VLHRHSGGAREYSSDAFLALPLHDRIEAIISGTLVFFLDERVVEQADALRAISSRQRKP